ncbi:MAG: hypothetical protein KIT84_39940 [Labilithrix sp.]|nr:hypothetical protein [Labilithrix sp.]MCW5817237.1 hypothetical protein [Labilithrix sp.]
MAEPIDLTVEILKQIRDGVLESKAEIVSLRNELSYRIDATNARLDATNERLDATNERLDATNERLDATNERLESLGAELRAELKDLKQTVMRVARISHETLGVSLDGSSRMDTLEGRVGTLEAQMRGLNEGR